MSGSSSGIMAAAKSATRRVIQARHDVRLSLRTALTTLKRVMRRRVWLFDNLTLGKIANLALSLVEYSLRAKRLSSMPFVVKIDISPLCSLRCPICLHADSTNQEKPLLKAQTFQKEDKMSVAEFGAVIDQVKGHAVPSACITTATPSCTPILRSYAGSPEKQASTSTFQATSATIFPTQDLSGLLGAAPLISRSPSMVPRKRFMKLRAFAGDWIGSCRICRGYVPTNAATASATLSSKYNISATLTIDRMRRSGCGKSSRNAEQITSRESPTIKTKTWSTKILTNRASGRAENRNYFQDARCPIPTR